jgi:hypothetical protein
MCCWIFLRSSKVSRVCRIDSAKIGSSSIGNVLRHHQALACGLLIFQLQTTPLKPCGVAEPSLQSEYLVCGHSLSLV